ncbi:MAG: hypothetical protein Hens3KO_14170 [Henriciella sp.]
MRSELVWFCAALMFVASALADELPPGVADPDKAIQHWSYSDPVFLWRLTSIPEDPLEPDPYFYWPNAYVHGEPGPFFDPVAPAHTSIEPSALAGMVTWAEQRDSNALIVIHKGQLVLEKYWNGYTPDRLVNGRAISRSVTPMVLGFAVADGKLHLDDRIGDYITEWADDIRGDITVRQLAQNTSGLEIAGMKPVSQVYGNKDLCLVYCGDVVRAALEYDYVLPPGETFQVAQENMQLLALVIERAMGQPIQDLLSERVWKKIGAKDATFQLDRPDGVARTMCCMRATPRDWTRLGVLISRDGVWNGEQVLPKDWADTMATPSSVNPNFGIGLWLGTPYDPMRTYFEGEPGVIPMSEPYLVDDVRIMEGGGFRAVYMSPSQDLVIFRHGVWVPDWDASYLINTAIRGIKK